jgi:uncharacterized OB-fold protein
VTAGDPTSRLHRPPTDGPVPTPTSLSQPFWDGCTRGALMFQRCRECGHANFEATPGCRDCGSGDLAWEESSGTGTLYSWVVISRPQVPEFTVPYACGIVTVDEGYRMLASLADCTAEDLFDGLPMRVDFQPTDAGPALPFFRPADAPGVRS